MRKNMPVSIEEEFIVDELITEADIILKLSKQNGKKCEIINRYKL